MIAGYPADYTREWATDGGGAGSWLTLTWAAPMTIDRIVLYDRPNGNDQVTAGTLHFSDGSTLATGALANGGTAVTLTFTARTVTSVQFTVDAVSANTLNIGLAEIQVYGAPAWGPTGFQASAVEATAVIALPAMFLLPRRRRSRRYRGRAASHTAARGPVGESEERA